MRIARLVNRCRRREGKVIKRERTLHDVIWPRTFVRWCPGKTHDEGAAGAVRGVDRRCGANNVDGEVTLCRSVEDADCAIGLPNTLVYTFFFSLCGLVAAQGGKYI